MWGIDYEEPKPQQWHEPHMDTNDSQEYVIHESTMSAVIGGLAVFGILSLIGSAGGGSGIIVVGAIVWYFMHKTNQEREKYK